MRRKALIIMSTKHCTTAQETLRVQDTAAAFVAGGWEVDVLTPKASPVLAIALPYGVRVYRLPRGPFVRTALFLKGVSLVRQHGYDILYGVDDGAAAARLIDRATTHRFAYIAEIHHPIRARSAIRHASAVVLPSENCYRCFAEPPPRARVSVLPDPHIELEENAMTFAEYREALERICTYAMRNLPEERT